MTSTREFVPLAPASHIISSVFIKLHLLHPLLVTLVYTGEFFRLLSPQKHGGPKPSQEMSWRKKSWLKMRALSMLGFQQFLFSRNLRYLSLLSSVNISIIAPSLGSRESEDRAAPNECFD